ncbi:ubiquitin carboxyl-terminal hydrolase 5 [Galendromus occidentalis]|uniref:Ubiquitin carboxyl-terminal hydrolase n=1 Tax=Galendromus occidentalis TaxID=34638 RepID=A0AAJ6QV07_9ACAR|nr:ubiquitin carboxyl-terminal hydrolase 5 [Galendromus occidentalis]
MSVSYESLKQIAVRVPGPSDRVYKDECAYSFTTPESEDGLYVSLYSFYGLSKQLALEYVAKTNYKAFLHIKRVKVRTESQKEEHVPPTRLAIGLEGGFQDAAKHQFKTEEQIVILPEGAVFNLDDPKLPEGLRKSAEGVVSAESAFKVAELESIVGTWDGEARQPSKLSADLLQLDNGVKIPPSGWKCSRCELTDNLWLNLTDGAINCGRSFFTGTGGNNHAIQHYNETHFPLVVKLGTITHKGADVYSYDEDDMVIDTHLQKHLAHFGIDMAAMQKTEKSMAELELDMNQRIGEWATCTEEGCKLEPLFGPGYTGLVNLGNSCYMNAVMQMLLTVPHFVRRYFEKYQGYIFRSDADPNVDLRTQMAKLAMGVLSGQYSKKPATDAECAAVRPQAFKNVVGRNHPEFSSKRQQDAEEFFCYLLDLLDKEDKEHPASRPFSFEVEERIQCSKTKMVAYKKREERVLRLVVPMDSATNKQEVEDYQVKKKAAELNKERLDPKGNVLAKIPMSACISAFMATEHVPDCFSAAANEKVTIEKTVRFLTFPEYLLVQVKKFTLAPDWTPLKLDISLDVPDELDLRAFRAKGGLQPGEESMPGEQETPSVQIDEGVVNQLVEMGFSREGCRKAVFFTKNSGLEQAMQWVMDHMGDPDFNDRLVIPGQADVSPIDDANIEMVMAMGFPRSKASRALRATQNNVERAIEWIFSNADQQNESSSSDEADEGSSSSAANRQGLYRLTAFITHMGSSTSSGHYVCHLRKEGRWVICNDEKVALSEKPPKDLAYLYLYQCIE